MSLLALLVPPVMRMLGFKRGFRTAEAMQKRMAKSWRRPVNPAPAARIRKRVTVTERTVGDWSVYEIAPRTGGSLHRVLYLHGGSYVFEITPTHWLLIAGLATASGATITVPIFPRPPLETAVSTVARTTDLAVEILGAAGPEYTTIAGDSSGGGLALVVAMQLRDRDLPSPHRVILIAPWLDITGTDPELDRIEPMDPWLAVPGSRAAGDAYRGELASDHPMVSPINGSFSGLGPITMFSGTRDILNADAARLLRAADAAGLQVDYHEGAGMVHNYPLLPISEGRAARKLIAGAITTPAE